MVVEERENGEERTATERTLSPPHDHVQASRPSSTRRVLHRKQPCNSSSHASTCNASPSTMKATLMQPWPRLPQRINHPTNSINHLVSSSFLKTPSLGTSTTCKTTALTTIKPVPRTSFHHESSLSQPSNEPISILNLQNSTSCSHSFHHAFPQQQHPPSHHASSPCLHSTHLHYNSQLPPPCAINLCHTFATASNTTKPLQDATANHFHSQQVAFKTLAKS